MNSRSSKLQRHGAVPADGDELGIVGVELLLPAIARDLDGRPNDRPTLISTVSRQSSTCQIAVLPVDGDGPGGHAYRRRHGAWNLGTAPGLSRVRLGPQCGASRARSPVVIRSDIERSLGHLRRLPEHLPPAHIPATGRYLVRPRSSDHQRPSARLCDAADGPQSGAPTTSILGVHAVGWWTKWVDVHPARQSVGGPARRLT